jgi:hypothetical protein
MPQKNMIAAELLFTGCVSYPCYLRRGPFGRDAGSQQYIALDKDRR